MNQPRNLYKDIFTGVFLISGLFSFMSGAFLISTVLFAAASLSSNIECSPAVSTQRIAR